MALFPCKTIVTAALKLPVATTVVIAHICQRAALSALALVRGTHFVGEATLADTLPADAFAVAAADTARVAGARALFARVTLRAEEAKTFASHARALARTLLVRAIVAAPPWARLFTAFAALTEVWILAFAPAVRCANTIIEALVFVAHAT